jgi:hypothetical protein
MRGTKDAASARLVINRMVTIVWKSAGTSVESPSEIPTITAASPKPTSIFFHCPPLKYSGNPVSKLRFVGEATIAMMRNVAKWLRLPDTRVPIFGGPAIKICRSLFRCRITVAD